VYLTEHPMGEVADQVGAFVNAYSGDLRDESLDGQRLVVGGIVTGRRLVITKARQTMGIVTMEDLQGSIEVVVFPRLHEQTMGTWVEGAILLVAGRVDHKGEEVSLLADLVVPWDEAVARGPEAFSREVAAGDRGRSRRSAGAGSTTAGSTGRPGVGVAVGPGLPVTGASGNGNGVGNGHGNGKGHASVVGGTPVPREAAPDRPAVPYVSPLRAGSPDARTSAPAAGLAIAPAEPIPTYSEPPDFIGLAPERDDEPPLPDEARSRAADAAAGPTAAVEASPDSVLHVRFSTFAGTDRVVGAMEAFKALLRDRPGATRVVLHLPGASGSVLPMELRAGVAYDAELLAEVRRRLGDGLIELQLGS
jgi:hypothetical protein